MNFLYTCMYVLEWSQIPLSVSALSWHSATCRPAFCKHTALTAATARQSQRSDGLLPAASLSALQHRTRCTGTGKCGSYKGTAEINLHDYTGSLFYLSTIVCHFRSLLRRAYGRYILLATLIRQTSRQEVATKWPDKK